MKVLSVRTMPNVYLSISVDQISEGNLKDALILFGLWMVIVCHPLQVIIFINLRRVDYFLFGVKVKEVS